MLRDLKSLTDNAVILLRWNFSLLEGRKESNRPLLDNPKAEASSTTRWETPYAQVAIDTLEAPTAAAHKKKYVRKSAMGSMPFLNIKGSQNNRKRDE